MEFEVLGKMAAQYMLLFFVVAIPVCGIYDMYTKWKEKQLTTGYVLSFLIRYAIAVAYIYWVYLEVISQ